jgi:hypothetical protein
VIAGTALLGVALRGATRLRESRAIGVVALAILAAACGGNAPAGGDSPAAAPAELASRPQTVSLIVRLQAAGLQPRFVELMESRSYPFVSVRAVRLEVESENVYTFEFATTAAAEAEARGISPDGHEVGSSQVRWLSDPHFYRSDRMIVLYVGQSERIRGALAEAVGPQFAGPI